MSQETKPIMLLFSIVESGKGKKLMETLNSINIKMHYQSVGIGTAPTEMMDILGLGTNNKDIIFSFATKEIVNNLKANFGQVFISHSKYRGIMIILPITSINRLVAEVLNHFQTDNLLEGGDGQMKNAHNHNLVMITVNRGYTDQVMEVAKRAGATGGTVIKSRLVEAENLSEIMNTSIEEEREILFIMAPTKVSYTIMEEVNKEFGLKSKAKGILCTVPIDKAYKI